MTKEQRKRVKEVYPKACSGDRAAIKELGQLTRKQKNKRRGLCKVCGVPISGNSKNPFPITCIMHRPHHKSAVFFRNRLN